MPAGRDLVMRHPGDDRPLAQAIGFAASAPLPQRLGGLLLAAVLLGLGPQSVYGPNGSVVVLGLILVGLCLCRPPAARVAARWERIRHEQRLLVFGLALACTWILVATFWAPVPTFEKALRSVALLGGGAAVVVLWTATREQRPRWLIWPALCGGGLMLAFFAFETATDGSLIWLLDPPGIDSPSLRAGRPIQNPVQQGTAVLTVLFFPLLVCLRAATARLLPLLAAFAVAAAVVVFLPMAASVVALAAGAVAYAGVRLFGRRVLDALVLLLALALLAGPVLATALNDLQQGPAAIDLPHSWQDRVGIWARSSQLIAERPLLGHGFHASRWLGSAAATQDNEGSADTVAPLPLHPHNAALQIWLELGLVGILIALTVIAGLWRAIGRLADEVSQAGATACLATFAVYALVSFGFWQSWLQALVWLAVVLVSLGAEARRAFGLSS